MYEDFMFPLQVGDTIPTGITLPAFHNGEEVNIDLDSYDKAWKIFFFYPADFTFVCPTELGELADLYSEFQKENAEIFSVSTDTVYVHKAWKDHSETISKVEFPMVADPSGALSELFGVYQYDTGLAQRGTFIIDPDGKIVAMEVHDDSIGRSGKELLRKLRAAKFVYEHGNKVCPASWEPGKDSLEPGMDLVGKI